MLLRKTCAYANCRHTEPKSFMAPAPDSPCVFLAARLSSLPSSPVWERTRSWSSVVVAVTLLWEEKRGAVSGDSRAAIPLLNHWCHVRRMETGSIARHRFRCSVLLSSKRKLLVRAYHLSRPLCFPFFFGVVVLCDSDVRGMTLPSLI
jgi:hypothetical protein